MQTKIARWGGSCALRIPKMAVDTLGLDIGDVVEMRIDGDRLIIRPDRPRYSLDALVGEAARTVPPQSEDDGAAGEETL